MRTRIKVLRQVPGFVQLALFINGNLASGQCGIVVRPPELVELILRLAPDRVEVDTEMVDDDIRQRLQGFAAVVWL